MKNWSGYHQWHPCNIFFPGTEEEIAQIVKNAINQNRKIRIIGSGHSFTPLCKTDDFLISLDKYQGIVSVNQEKNQVTVKAGTKLHYLNELLANESYALENMGDINVQSIAGAISTGTHGTGTSFGNLSTQVAQLKFVNGQGEIITCSNEEQPELFNAAQVSLGALGILTEITVQCVPSYNLELKVEKKRLDWVLQNYEGLNRENRNFEFFWFPNTPYVMAKVLNKTQKAPDKFSYLAHFQELVMENYAFKLICDLSCGFPSMTRQISNFAASTIGSQKKINKSYKVFSTPRIVRFNEMEYSVPIEAYREVKQEIVKWINRHNYKVLFPIENRFVKGDDIFLSPSYNRDSAYVAVHVYHKKGFKEYFNALESIFKAYEGRPHWGKMHNLSNEEIVNLYPKFERFCEWRDVQDPNQLFLSPYLHTLLVGNKANKNVPSEI